MTEPFLLLTRACLFLENQKVAPRELTFRCSCSCGEAASTQTCFRWHTQPSDACRNLQSKLADFNYDSAPTETQRQLFVAQTGINKGWDYRGSLSQLQLHYPDCLHVYGGEERLSLPPFPPPPPHRYTKSGWDSNYRLPNNAKAQITSEALKECKCAPNSSSGRRETGLK